MKIAIISSSLVQSGAERFVYEHAVQFKKYGHECVVITKTTEDGYYVDQLDNAGIPVRKVLGRRIVLSRLGCRRLTRFLHCIFSYRDYLRVRPKQYDVVLVNQIETYSVLARCPLLVNNSVVLLMSHKFQYAEDPYAAVDKPLRVYVMDDKQEIELAESNILFESVKYPLSFDVNEFESVHHSASEHEIAYFARLSPQRPVEFVFFALHLLRRRLPKARLHVFGRGTLSFEQKRLLSVLGLDDAVVFEGHAVSIPDALRENNISVVWLPCLGGTVGYAPLEIMAHRFPLVLWNLDPHANPQSFCADNHLDTFVDRTISILSDPEYADAVVDAHYAYVKAHCDVTKNSAKLLAFANGSDVPR